MEGSFALQLSKLELDPTPLINISGCDKEDLQDEDRFFWGDADEKFGKVSELEREWQKRHDKFYTMGYRDGLIAGKEASAQVGFNIGFTQSFPSGYNWGLVRGVTSALACLPDELKEMLVETQENRNNFQALYESVRSLSTADALKLFNDEVVTSEAMESEASSSLAGPQEQSSECSRLENHCEELQSLLHQTPAIEVHLTVNK